MPGDRIEERVRSLEIFLDNLGDAGAEWRKLSDALDSLGAGQPPARAAPSGAAESSAP